MALAWKTQRIPWGRSESTQEQLAEWLDQNTSLFKYAYDKSETVFDAPSDSSERVALWKNTGSVWYEMRFYGGSHTGSTSSTVGIENYWARTTKVEGTGTSGVYQRLDSTTLWLYISEAETKDYYFFEILREGTSDAYDGEHDFHVVRKDGAFHWLCGGDSYGSVTYGTTFYFPDLYTTYYNNKFKGNVQARSDASTFTNKRIMQKLYIRGNDYGIWTIDGGQTANNLNIKTEFTARGKNFIQIGAGLALEM